MIDEKTLIARKLKRFRQNNNLNQYEFAEECGISRNLLSLIETESENLTLDTLNLIAIRLGVTLSDLLNPSEVLYLVLPSTVVIEDVTYDTYGIGVVVDYVLEDYILDVSVEFEKVHRLVKLCNEEDLSAIHLRDVVDDFLNA